MRRPSHTPISRRLGAVALSITILWVVFAAAGSDTVGGAMEALSRQGQLPIALLRQELGDIQREDLLTMATELVKGKSVQEAMTVTNKAVMEALDGLPPVKVHCSLLAEEAIHAALWDYAQKHGIEIQGLEKPKTDIGEEEEEEEY